MKKDFDELRMCRVDGRKPTARERWIAFHRLWRLSHGHGAIHDVDATDCFRVLCADWSKIRLLDCEGEKSPSRVTYPISLRRRLLKEDRRLRIFGTTANQEYCKLVARRCSSRGLEVTPEEVAGIREKMIAHIREQAAADGVTIPADDDELMRWLKQGLTER